MSYAASPPSLRPFSVSLEGPEALRPLQRYAVEELLRPLGRRPAWTRTADLPPGGLYHGPTPERLPPTVVRVRLRETTAEVLLRRTAVAAEAVTWWAETSTSPRLPLPFPLEGGEIEEKEAGPVEADLISSAAFWLMGMQELASPIRDQHGRFPYEASLQRALGTPLLPVVDHLRLRLVDALRAVGTPVRLVGWGGAAWSVALTHDVDHLPRPWLRRLASYASRSQWREAFRTVGGTSDPRQQSLDALRDLAARLDVTATWFLKAGTTTAHDSPDRLTSQPVARLLNHLNAVGHEVGLHPSYAAAEAPEVMRAERDRFVEVSGGDIESVRMHFLRWQEPVTPRALTAQGFLRDATLGFAAHEGFRRGTCHPFRLFDVDAGASLPLWEWPLAAMDTTFTEAYLGSTPGEMERRLDHLLAEVRRVGGCVVLLWHPGADADEGWSKRLAVLERLLRRADEAGARIGSLRDLFRGAP